VSETKTESTNHDSVQDWQKGKYKEPWRACSHGCRCMSIMEYFEGETGADDWFPRMRIVPTHDGVASATTDEYVGDDFDLPPRIVACVNACANIPENVLASDDFLNAIARFRRLTPTPCLQAVGDYMEQPTAVYHGRE
jgi:hypothetical protein